MSSTSSPIATGKGGILRVSKIGVFFLFTAGVVRLAIPQTYLPEMESIDGGGIYYCGWLGSTIPIGKTIFPDYARRYQGGLDRNSHKVLGFKHRRRKPNANDILIHGLHGPCTASWEDFPGKVLICNGEPWEGNNVPNITALKGRATGEGIYQIGTVPDDNEHTILSYFFVWGYLLRFMAKDGHNQTMLRTLSDHSQKPINTGLHHAVVYANSNCPQHREQAINNISNILPIHTVGSCKGAEPHHGVFIQVPKANLSEHATTTAPRWTRNVAFQRNYKFCFAMENTYPYEKYYISEKILNPFLAGCIPIYYGSPEVFDIFNPKAFVYYDPSNPEPALQQLLELSQNDTAYYEMLHNQPILAQGNETVRKHFSLMESVGGGYLKHRIRDLMGV